MGQVAADGVCLRAGAGLLGPLWPREFSLVLRHRVAHERCSVVDAESAAGEHASGGRHRAGICLDRRFSAALARGLPRCWSERIHVRSDNSVVASGIVAVPRVDAVSVAMDGLSLWL